ncbi:MAG TPA: beta-L-arabinofuranosidase domain-containing protein [Fimbriimonadaceae bacterium]|nr:beta-L-arabinofuranosidase domain-containing protein [Fimbriimonadaceae bacterium]
MQSLPLSDIRLHGPFWPRWQQALVETMLPAQYEQLEGTGRLANFRRAAKLEEGEHQGLFFNDSDVYKWVEAASYAVALDPDAGLRSKVDDIIGWIAAAQEEDGYLNTFFQLKHPNLKWRNLNTMHEMYCAGHLIEAGVANFGCTGSRSLLEVAVRLADHICSIFGPGKRLGYCGHQELELALIRLADAAGQEQYRELAAWMVEARGHRPSPFEAELEDEEALALSPWAPEMLKKEGVYNGEYAQDHAPIREHVEVVGHAVRAMYFYTAAAQLSPDEKLVQALETVWSNLTGKRMYITGGIGPAAKNEGFTADYDLPNLSAYAETCAAVGLAMWGKAMLHLTGNSEYADVMEMAIYNGAISGVSLDGSRYFYTNPLESRGAHERVDWFACACCPPNVARLIGSLAQYCVSLGEAGVFIHIPVAMSLSFEWGGTPVLMNVVGDYPWSGKVELRLSMERPVRFPLHVRVPGWCDDFVTEVQGMEEPAGFENGYAVFNRVWENGDVLRIDMDLRPKWMEANPAVLDDLGRVVLTCGPLVYCAEDKDLDVLPQRLLVDTSAEPEISFQSDLLGGVNRIVIAGAAETDDFPAALYAEAGESTKRPIKATLIPYYSWSNRGPSHMAVWLRQ